MEDRTLTLPEMRETLATLLAMAGIEGVPHEVTERGTSPGRVHSLHVVFCEGPVKQFYIWSDGVITPQPSGPWLTFPDAVAFIRSVL